MEGRAGRPSALALAQAQHLGQPQTQRQLVQGVLLDQVGAHARQIALGSAQPLVQQVATARLSTESPRNSRRSLWSAENCGA
jgi:hypothetical protein